MVFKIKSGLVWIGASQFVLLVINFVLLKLMTSQMSVESFGYYSLCMTIVLFARQVIYDPISIVAAKNCATAVNDMRRISEGFYVVRFLTDRLGILFFLLGILFCLIVYSVVDSFQTGLVVLICLIYLGANGAQGIYFNLLNSLSERRSAAIYSILDSVFKLMLICVFFWIFENKFVYTLMAISAGAFLVFFSVRYHVKKYHISGEIPVKSLKDLVKSILLMSLPLFLPTLLGAFKSVGDRWILAAIIGVDELAVYSVLLQIGYFPIILSVGVAQTFVAPKIYGLCGLEGSSGFGDLKQFLHKLLFWIFIFTSVTSCVSIYLADFVFELFVGKVYRDFSLYLPFFVIAGAFAAGAGVLHIAVIGVFETRVVGRLMIASVFVSIAVAYLLIFAWGLIGAIVGLVFASAASAFLYWLALHQKFLVSR